MNLQNISKLVLAGSCVLLAATGCGQTEDPVDTSADPSSLHGDNGQVQGARGDRNWNGDKDDIGAGQGAAGQAAPGTAGGAAPTDKPGRGPGRFDPDADGGVDEDCEFGPGFRDGRWGHRDNKGGNKGGRDDQGRGDAGPDRGDAAADRGDAGAGSDDDQRPGRGGRR